MFQRAEQRAASPLKREERLRAHRQTGARSVTLKCCLASENVARSKKFAYRKCLNPLFKPKPLAGKKKNQQPDFPIFQIMWTDQMTFKMLVILSAARYRGGLRHDANPPRSAPLPHLRCRRLPGFLGVVRTQRPVSLLAQGGRRKGLRLSSMWIIRIYRIRLPRVWEIERKQQTRLGFEVSATGSEKLSIFSFLFLETGAFPC